MWKLTGQWWQFIILEHFFMYGYGMMKIFKRGLVQHGNWEDSIYKTGNSCM